MGTNVREFFATYYPSLPIEDAAERLLMDVGELTASAAEDLSVVSALVEAVVADITEQSDAGGASGYEEDEDY